MKKALKGVDIPLLIMYLSLVLFGILNIYSVSETSGTKQLMWFGISLFIGIVIFMIQAHFFEAFSVVFYIIGIMLLILLFPLGSVVNGAKAWFVFGPISLQPVEFVKIATTLMLASIVNLPKFNFYETKYKVRALGVILIPIILILLQPDVGSILVFTAFFIALFREGMSGVVFLIGGYFAILFLTSIKEPVNALIFLSLLLTGLNLYYLYSYVKVRFIYLILCFLVLLGIIYLFSSENHSFSLVITYFVISLLGVLVLIFFKEKNKKQVYMAFGFIALVTIPLVIFAPTVFEKLPKHQKERIDVLFEGEAKYRDTAGYNLLYAKTAIGSGGFWGKGYNKGTVTDGKFVPEQRTDYIFCTVGEEWGFVGSSLLLILYACFILRIYYLAETHESAFIRVIGYCMASIFFMHFIINVGMVIGLFPTVGIPLPYFSYGGSSLLAFSSMFFIFLRLHYFGNRTLV
ncbi:MAG: rod shape-determining protein RodA [Flavobacteriales bacterium]|nr:rod shape-determining protein RodA [Flavobacteriales bacterium]